MITSNDIRTRARRASGSRSVPTWDVAQLFPTQGQWSVEEYLDLPGNHLIELSDGFLEFLPMPTPLHQWIVFYLCELLKQFAWPKLGLPLVAPMPIELWPGKMREPDIMFLLKKNRERAGKEFWKGADLVMEVVSKGANSRRRDLIEKRKDYARAGIAEYWIVDPELQRITVFHLKAGKYQKLGVYKKGTQAVSRLLPGFAVNVDAAFAGPDF